MNSEQEEQTCKFCLSNEEFVYDKLISPCNCDGNIKYIHELCLLKWLAYWNISPTCTICKRQYKFIPGDSQFQKFRYYHLLGCSRSWYIFFINLFYIITAIVLSNASVFTLAYFYSLLTHLYVGQNTLQPYFFVSAGSVNHHFLVLTLTDQYVDAFYRRTSSNYWIFDN